MAIAKLTLIGLYNYYPNLFDFLSFPAGIDPDTARDNILMKSGEFEVLYSDPDFIHDSIKLWSAKWYKTFDKWIKALNTSYDPLNNYDRHEEWSDTGAENRKTSGTGSTSGKTTDTNSVNLENKISAYNSSTYQPDTTSTSATNGSTTMSDTSSTSGTDDVTRNNLRKGRAWGNIGVMTSQAMLTEEYKVALWNLYDHIADVFLQEYIIPVY